MYVNNSSQQHDLAACCSMYHTTNTHTLCAEDRPSLLKGSVQPHQPLVCVAHTAQALTGTRDSPAVSTHPSAFGSAPRHQPQPTHTTACVIHCSGITVHQNRPLSPQVAGVKQFTPSPQNPPLVRQSESTHRNLKALMCARLINARLGQGIYIFATAAEQTRTDTLEHTH